jgi:hypothetical protein
MRPTALHGFLIGIALAALVAVGGRYAAENRDSQAAKQSAEAAKLRSEFDECVKAYFAAHPPGKAPNFISLKDLNDAVSIPCAQSNRAAAADDGAASDEKYSRMFQLWPPRVAAALFLVFAAPWLWQFLLRRVTELGAAFRGRQ